MESRLNEVKPANRLHTGHALVECGVDMSRVSGSGMCPAVVAQAIRGGNKVTDRNPEGKFEALSKYARDLTAAARDGKLDPVIGRDEQIRCCRAWVSCVYLT